MGLDDLGVWGLIAAVIGGVMSALKRLAPPSWAHRRWWKDGVLPLAPLLLGCGLASIPDLLDGALTLRLLYGLSAGMSAGWAYDRWRDRLRARWDAAKEDR